MAKIIETDHSESSAAPSELVSYELLPQFDIGAWSPQPPGTPNATPTQVHLSFGTPPARFTIRFKGPDTLDALIQALQKYRKYVWGKRS
jgi:hypothetical protein